MRKTVLAYDLHERWDLLDEIATFCAKGYRLILGGDYVDSFEAEGDGHKYLEEVCSLLRAFSGIGLIGNHDEQYIDLENRNKACSGRQDGRSGSSNIAYLIHDVFQQNLDLFQYAYLEEDRLFTHAGVSTTLYDKAVSKYGIKDMQDFVTLANKRFKEMYFIGRENGGSDPYSGLLWARPNNMTPIPGYRQYVGHTYHPYIREKKNMTIVDYGKPYLIYE